MEFRILGPLEVTDRGRPVPVVRQKQRALLAVLLLHAGEVVSVDRLLYDLWGETPPTTAKASLQNAISLLRKVVGPELLVTRAPGYLLDVAPGQVDLLRFEQLVEEAQHAPPAERAAKLREALSLWHGEPLADLAFEPFAAEELPRLEELRTATEEQLVGAELALGRHADLVPRLEALIAAHPLRERLRGQLMLALYRSGRQADALAAYQQTRRVLVEELGIEPSPALRELESGILRQDPSLRIAAEGGLPVPPREAPERRRRATVLFAEIVADAPGLDVEALHRAAGRALQEVRAAVEYHGGTVVRVAGDEALAVFGVPSAHEDDALRALRAADQLRRSLGREQGIRLEVRCAVTSGEVLTAGALGRPEVSGEPVTLAKRLAQAGQEGEFLVEAETLRVAGNAVEAVELPPLVVRAAAEPVPVARIGHVAAAAPPRPRSSAMVGRAAELAQISEAFDAAVRDRRARLLSILGEPGIGKSRLAAEFATLLGDRARTLVGRCVSYGEGATYLPLREIVTQTGGDVAAIVAGEERAELVAQRVAELVGLAEGAAPTGEAFWAVGRFVRGLARERPLVLVLDDVHWAEPTLLDLVDYLGEHVTDVPVLLLCLARPDLLETRPSWGASSVVRLGPLAPEESGALVEVLAPESLPAPARARVAELAEGNPLFAEQLLALAAEEGAEALASVPPSVEALIASRLDRLPADERTVLDRAAVVGREFWQGALLALSPRVDVPAVGRHLRELERKGLVRPGRSTLPRHDALRFHHVLIRDVTYGAIPKEARAELHERVADWLEPQLDGNDELVGYHLEQAYRLRADLGLVDGRARRLAADAGARLGGAGVRAWRHADAPAAVNLLGRAIDLLPPDAAARPELLRELAAAVVGAAHVDQAAAMLEQAIAAASAAGDRRTELRAEIDLAYLRAFADPEGRADELLDLAARAIPVFEALGDDRFLGWTWLTIAFVHGGTHCRYQAAEEAVQRALAHYRRLGWLPATCVRELGIALYYGPTPVGKAISQCRALVGEADRSGEASIRLYTGGLSAMRGRIAEGRRLADEARAAYEELGWAAEVATSWAPVAADIETLAGDHEAAERILRESCRALEEMGGRGALATRAAQLAGVLYGQGLYDEAERWTDIAEANAASDDATVQPPLRAVRAVLLAQRGAAAEAEALAREAARLAEATDALNDHARVLLALVEVLRLGDRHDEARACVAEAVDLYERKGNKAAARKARAVLRAGAPV